MNYQNPYGAVPRALENSRLALRDIMSDYLATKTMDANMNLMMKKAETENAMVGANLERARMGQELDLAKMAQGQQNWQQTFDQHKEESQANRQFKERELGLQEKRDARAAHAQKMALSDLTPGKAIDIMGQAYPNIPAAQRGRILTAAGFDPNAVTTPQALKQYQGMLLPVQRTLMQEDFKSTMDKASQATDPKVKTQLLDQANQIAMQAKSIDQFLTKEVTPESAAKIFKQLESAGSIPAGTNFNEFYEGLNTIKKQSTEAMAMLSQAQNARAKHAADPNYDKKFIAYTNQIRMLDDPAHVEQIKKGLEQRADDPAAALEYAQGWARHLSSKKTKQTAAKSTAMQQDTQPEELFFNRFDR